MLGSSAVSNGNVLSLRANTPWASVPHFQIVIFDILRIMVVRLHAVVRGVSKRADPKG